MDGPPGPARKRASKTNRLQKSLWPVTFSLVSFTSVNAPPSLSAVFTLPSTLRCSAGTGQAPGACWVSERTATSTGLVTGCPTSVVRTEATPLAGHRHKRACVRGCPSWDPVFSPSGRPCSVDPQLLVTPWVLRRNMRSSHSLSDRYVPVFRTLEPPVPLLFFPHTSP